MKIALILMIRNEERILKRCLEAVENVADIFCICDTGSTDKTEEIALEFLNTREGCLGKSEWKDFGYNRTASFIIAQEYLEKTYGKEELKNIYGLLLDADMVFVPGQLKTQNLTETGYTIVQCGGNLEYPNTRLIRMDYDWRCIGVTHEYWSGPTTHLPKSICYIDDKNDGGCKADKFERDAALLEKGLSEEPENVRYMFYLAQTYHALGKWQESIKMYKRRIASGNWFEEIWYSHYMIAQTYLTLGNPIKFEQWMLMAYKYRPQRTESLYKLARHFREAGQHYKAYEYAIKGLNTPPTEDSLFIEKNVYNGLFNYEISILDYYVKSDKSEGCRSSIKCMLKCDYHISNVVSNLKFYISQPKNTRITPLEIENIFGEDFRPSAISVSRDVTNVRYINYTITPEGGYLRPGPYIETKNACKNIPMVEEIDIPKREFHIKGYEDLRLYRNSKDELCFAATFLEKEGNAFAVIARGKYDHINNLYKDCFFMNNFTDCEKNWLPIDGTDRMIYNWSPLKIGIVNESNLEIDIVHNTPPLFSIFRGSASPIKIENELWALVHFIEDSSPRKYYHCFVSLDCETYKPKAVSLPFVFKSISIEYCISCRFVEKEIEFNVSFMDRDPSLVTFPIDSIEWISL
jgi:glycosyltransferase involved in cell wall biosynthesis